MKKILLLLFLFSLNFTHAQVTVSLNSTKYSIVSDVLGLNGRSTEGPSWDDLTFQSMIDTMNPAYVRYPAGTQGNDWNWATGTFIPGYGSSPYAFTIPKLLNGLPVGTKVIYMINMVLPTPQTGISYTTTTDAVLSTDATLLAKISDILNAIEAFKTAGHLPEICEIGNELYFGGSVEAGVYANNVTLYLKHAKTIVQAIKASYPTIDIILCTTRGGTTSRDNWNTAVFNALNTDASFKALVRGVVQHHYINANWGGYQGVVSDVTTAKTLINEGMQYVQQTQTTTDYNNIPSPLKLWVTEYGATTTNADGMWASGLRLANMTFGFLQLGTKLENLMWHHITDDPNILNKAMLKLGPSGMTFSLLSKAMIGKTAFQKVVFSNMNIADPYATMYALKFTKLGEESLVILNMDNVTYNAVNLSSLFSISNVVYNQQYWSATPYVKNVYDGNNISVVNNANILNYSIKPFSISVITTRFVTVLKKNTLSDKIRIYPTNISSSIQIDIDKTVINSKVRILDLTGRTYIYLPLSANKNTLSTTHLGKGMYMVCVENETEIFTQKVIKM